MKLAIRNNAELNPDGGLKGRLKNVTLEMNAGTTGNSSGLLNDNFYADGGVGKFKIQARSLNVYSASVPTRDYVRKDNYDRRRNQMASMGFRTPSNVPYRNIGEFNLDTNQFTVYGHSHQPLSASAAGGGGGGESEKTYFLKTNPASSNSLKIKETHDKFIMKKMMADKENSTSSMQIRPLIDSDCEYEPESEDELIDVYADVNRATENFSPETTSVYNQVNTAISVNSEFAHSDLKSAKTHKIRILATDEKEKADLTAEKASFGKMKSLVNNNRPQTFPMHYTNQTPTHAPNSVAGFIFGDERNVFVDKVNKSERVKMEEIKKKWDSFLTAKINEKEDRISKLASREQARLAKLRKTSALANRNLNESVQIEETDNEEDLDRDNTNQQKKLIYETPTPSDMLAFSFANNEDHPLLANKLKKQTSFNQNINNNNNNNNNLVESTFSLNNVSDNVQLSTLQPVQTVPQLVPQTANNFFSNTNTPGQQQQTADNSSKVESNRDSTNYYSIDPNDNNNNYNNNNNLKSSDDQNLNATSSLLYDATAKVIKANKLLSALGGKGSKKKKQQTMAAKSKAVSTLPPHEMELIKIGNEDDFEKIFNKYGTRTSRKNAKGSLAETGPIQALWTPKVYDFQDRLQSAKKQENLNEIKSKFVNTTDEQTIEIHKRLEELIKKRSTTCLVKYSSLDLKQKDSIGEILKKMNKCYRKYEEQEDTKNSPTPKYYQWYMDLEYLVDNFFSRDDTVLGRLLDKLAVYGKLTAKKQNELAFFRVLNLLKVWEFLSPDVMSAVEFCREKILEIKIEDFESWFQTKMPDYFISRQALLSNSTAQTE